MDEIRRLYRESPTQPTGEQEDRDTIRCEGATCREVFVVERVGDASAWRCPKCETRHPNLHLHFLLLGLATALLVVASFAALILFLVLTPEREIALVPYVIWSAVQVSLGSYVVLAVFSDKRSYGLMSLRVLLPLGFASLATFTTLLGARLWLPFAFIGGALGLGLFGYLAFVFFHAFRMAQMHRPREGVVRPMYTLISVTVHVIVLAIFTSVFIYEQKRTPGTSSVEFGKPGGYVPTTEQIRDLEPEELEPEELEIREEEIEPELEELDTPERHESIEYQTESDVSFHKVEKEDKQRIRSKRRTTRNVKYQQRYDRQWALEQGGGSDDTEDAVLKALRWLKRHQNEDGSWGEAPLQPCMTGLALLCFLGHGEDHLSEEFGRTVRDALEWLMNNQDSEGYLEHEHRFAYQHGMATYALAEAYAMTELEAIKPVVTKAVEVILHGQTDEGGWYYSYTKGGIQVTEYETGRQYYKGDWPGGDTSVCSWQIQALQAAWYAGIRFPNGALRNARRKALRDIKSRVDAASGWSGYQDTAPRAHGDTERAKKEWTYALTGIATLCIQFLGDGRGEEARSMLRTMKKYRFDWERTKGGRYSAPLYAWYYVTQAKFQDSGPKPAANPYWQQWNTQMKRTLLREQHRDGSWGFPTQSLEGKQHIEGTKNKPVYATTLCCLMLEVYYRYLPTYQLVGPQR